MLIGRPDKQNKTGNIYSSLATQLGSQPCSGDQSKVTPLPGRGNIVKVKQSRYRPGVVQKVPGS